MMSKELMEYLSKYGEQFDLLQKEKEQIKEAFFVDVQCVKYAYVPIKIDKK